MRTRPTYRLLFGPLAGAILACGVAGLATLVPGFSHVRQTVSEIGEIGSPARVPFAVMLLVVASCLVVFASAVRDVSVVARRGQVGAYLIGFMAVSAAGVGVFAHPHPLHNVFGLSELIGYQAPLALALAWRRDRGARAVVVLSSVAAAATWIAIALNLSALDRQGVVWAHLRPVYGVVQRALFAIWFGWCAAMGVLLLRAARIPLTAPGTSSPGSGSRADRARP